MIDPYGHLAYLRAEELRRTAEEHRRHVVAERAARPSLLLRLYARAWWASRPRAERWTPALLESWPMPASRTTLW
ncbi:hypothetical protein ACQEVB_01960 [Pseudonocardia sp. CA-107938]|uniref:hypothetical protein n=1 Tax=Pseudonocardia sp. CA-107938 TaxID=3240021 RepID=UPI003D8E05DF